jgi:hypothetical protein
MITNDEIKKIIDYEVEDSIINRIKERFVEELPSVIIMITADILAFSVNHIEYTEFLKKHDNYFWATK